jgi:methylenetetrahydrofolate dehydrogenase (NADP+)/methenyltetrahydrofolate cyclohydrolase
MVKKTVFRGIFLAYLCGMKILDGKLVSQAVKSDLKDRVDRLLANGGKKPHLAAILVGNNGASETYLASKVKSCEEVGFTSTLVRLQENIEENELLSRIKMLNDDDDVDGILVQLPLPKHSVNKSY